MPSAKRGGATDSFGALPDALLQHMLSFLPSEEAVRTCVLASRWRHLWKSAPGLRIGCLGDDEGKAVSLAALRSFVDRLLLLRAGSPLDRCELRVGALPDYDNDNCFDRWLRQAVACKARVLKLYVNDFISDYWYPFLVIDDLPLVSKHLTTLDLFGVRCPTRFVDFLSCPALEDLKCKNCDFDFATKISSESLKSLSIICSYFPKEPWLRICTPNLVSFLLDDFSGGTPILESMPSLVEAFVRVTSGTCSDDVDNSGCVLLKGLSEAKMLELNSLPKMVIFQNDLRWCPTFSKLKSLFLNDYWCVPDHGALACILEHSPVLEKLTLHLFSKGPNHNIEMKGTFSSIDRSTAISEQLKIVEIKCDVIDERISKVLKFLCTFNLSFTF